MITTDHPLVREKIANRTKILAELREMERRKVIPYRPFYEVMSDHAWAGKRCFIIGGGPSLEGFDFERLRGQGKIIAINKAYLDVPFADILFFMDGSTTTFYGLVKNGRLGIDALEKWSSFQGYKVYLNLVGRRLEDVYSVRSAGPSGLSNSIKSGLYHGNNSGVGAVGLAICLGANPIYLLGIDCKFKDGKSHYHSGYPGGMPEKTFKSFARNFEKQNRFINRTRFKVINLNPDSEVTCFPFSTIEEVLGSGQTR